MGTAEPTGVLVMAYGTPATPEDIEAYYTHVRRGRPPTPELLADLRRRYDAIGGTSPLLERTRSQAAGVAEALGPGYVVELGMKHAPPFIEDGVAALAEAGAGRVVGLVLAPHYSRLSADRWIGPDILDVLRARAADGASAVLVCPAGFVSDHLEILFDLDVEARALAADLGIAFARTRMPNDDARFCRTLAGVIGRAAAA